MDYTRSPISDLSGLHSLTAIDRYNEERGPEYGIGHECVEVCRITLDGVTYEFFEDPSDGYRSGHYGPHVVDGHCPKNTFAPVSVVCQHVEKSSGEYVDIIRIINAETGKIILDVGTDNIDDYYPSWVCDFSAEEIGVYKEASHEA